MGWGAAWFTERRSSTACVCTRVQKGNEHSRLGLGAVTARVRRVQAAVAPRTMLESFGWEVKVARQRHGSCTHVFLQKRTTETRRWRAQHGCERGGVHRRCTNIARRNASITTARPWTRPAPGRTHVRVKQRKNKGRVVGGRRRRRASSYSPKASSPGSTPPIAARKVWRDCICCQRSSSCAAAAARDGWQAGRGAARESWTHAREHSWAQRELRSRACWSRSASCSEASSGDSGSPSAPMSGASPGVAAIDLAAGPGVFSWIAW